MQKQRLPGLHGLRALAAGMVILYHVHAIPGLAVPAWLNLATTHFGLGVHLFFVLSAFSLAYNHVGDRSWRAYFFKRFFRIAPLFYLMFVLYSTAFGWPGWNASLLNLSFLFNFVPGLHLSHVWAGWTIGVEMMFYVVLPLLMMQCTRLAHWLVFCALAVAVSLAARAGITASGIEGYAHEAFIANLGFFALGLLAWAFMHARPASAFRYRLAVLAAAVLTMLLLSWPGVMLIGPARADLMVWGVVFSLLAYTQAVHPVRLFANQWAIYLGERSFSLYLLHPPLIHLLRPVYHWLYEESGLSVLAFIPSVLITFAILVPLAALSYRFIERPGMALGHRINAQFDSGRVLAQSSG